MTRPPARRKLAPPARATALYARTVYRELRRAEYSRQEVVAFINELLERVAAEVRDGADGGEPDKGPLDAIVDAQTGAPNAAVATEIVDLEIRRARDRGGDRPLLVVALEVIVPSWRSSAEAHAAYERVARVALRRIRSGDSLARFDAESFLLVLPGATPDLVEPLRRRLASAMGALGAKDRSELTGEVSLTLRWAALGSDIAKADDLIRCCYIATATPVLAGAGRESQLPRPESLMPRLSFVPSIVPVRPMVAGPAIVLALGAGGASAAAHLGILRVLRRRGIHVGGISGTSGGALVGAMFLVTGDEGAVVARLAELPHTPIYRALRRAFARQARGGQRAELSGGGWAGRLAGVTAQAAAVSRDLYAELIEHLVGPDRDLATLPIPFAACATDLRTEGAVTLAHGPLHAALRASCALPGLFAPEDDGGRVLVDGGFTAEVPILAAAHLRVPAPTLAVYLERALSPLDSASRPHQIAARAQQLVGRELTREQMRHAELVVSAPVGAIGPFEYARAEEAARLGEEAMVAVADALEASLDSGARPDRVTERKRRSGALVS